MGGVKRGPPPDFSKNSAWKLKEESNLYWLPEDQSAKSGGKIIIGTVKEGNCVWFGVMREYMEINGTRMAREIFFWERREVRIKAWGQLFIAEDGKKHLPFFAVFYNGEWITFSGRRYYIILRYRPNYDGMQILVLKRRSFSGSREPELDFVVFRDDRH